MKATVIIPAHNEEAVIARGIAALLAQDYPNFEVIVVDNGNTDRTFEIASKFPVKVVREHRLGTMWACERGRAEASGDIIVRMDADCEPERGWLSKGISHFSDPKVVIVSGPYDYTDGHRSFRRSALMTQRYVFKPVHEILQLFDAGGVTMGGNTFVRADALERAGGFNTDITFYGDDTELPRRLSKYGRIIFHTKLIMPTSARRYRKEGMLRLQARYIFHFFKEVLK